jgi:hypothetical protein
LAVGGGRAVSKGAGPSREWRRRRILVEKENRAGRRKNEEYGWGRLRWTIMTVLSFCALL